MLKKKIELIKWDVALLCIRYSYISIYVFDFVVFFCDTYCKLNEVMEELCQRKQKKQVDALYLKEEKI